MFTEYRVVLKTHYPIVVDAENEEEAKKLALEEIELLHPIEGGWSVKSVEEET